MVVPIVDPSKCEISSAIRFYRIKGTPPVDIRRHLTEVYGEKCMSLQHVRKWCREFRAGGKEVHVEERSGKPSVSEAVIGPRTSNYHLFPKLKEHLGGQLFRSDNDVKEEVKRFLSGLTPEFDDVGLQKLEHRLQKMRRKDGDYVEK